MDAATPYKPTLLIKLDDRLSKEDEKIVIDTLESIFRMIEGVSEVTIPRCYSNESCKYFPPHDHTLQSYIIRWEQHNERNGVRGVDVLSLIRDIRRYDYIRYPINSHHHIIVIYPPACDLFCEKILFGMTWPIVTTSFLDKEGIFEAAGVAVISIGSTKMFYGDNWSTAFHSVATHTLGQLFGLPHYKSPYRKDLYCSYEYCAMGDIYDEKRLDNILRNNPHLYCKSDLWYLRKNLEYIFGGQYESYLEFINRRQYKS